MKPKYRLPPIEFPRPTLWADLLLALMIIMIIVTNAFCQIPSDVRTRPPGVLLDVAWSSCPDGSDWTERSFRYMEPRTGRILWTLHLGPQDEFALFVGDADTGEHRDHTSRTNLLTGFHFDSIKTVRRSWALAQLHLLISVNRVTGSRDTEDRCENFLVQVRRIG